MKVIAIMPDNTQVFEYDSEHIPVTGDVVFEKNVRYAVTKRVWIPSEQKVVLVVEWT